MPDMHVWPPIRMDWRKTTKTRDSILRMNQTIVYVGFNAVEYNLGHCRAKQTFFRSVGLNMDEKQLVIFALFPYISESPKEHLNLKCLDSFAGIVEYSQWSHLC